MGLYLHASNDTEHLFGCFMEGSERHRSPDPLASEIVVVQSHLMFEWLSLRIARCRGIAFNLRRFFPNTFLEELYHRLKGIPEWRSYESTSPSVLAWTLASLLQDLGGVGGRLFEPVQGYLAAQSNASAHFLLARRLAALYNKYLVFRFRTVLSWEESKRQGSRASTWQEALWHAVLDRTDEPHLLRMRQEVLASLSGEGLQEKLPNRISLFGMASLPEFYNDVFLAMSKHVDVHVYLSTMFDASVGEPPSEPYATLSRKTWEGWRSMAVPVSCGLVLREPKSMLDLVKQRYLRGGEATSSTSSKPILQAFQEGRDGSVCVHSSASLFREVEVLYHNLLHLLNERNIGPGEVLVAAPDIQLYVPWVHFVFGHPESGLMRVPYSMPQEDLGAESLEDDFLALLTLVKKRLTFDEVFGFLGRRSAQRALGLSEVSVARLKACFREVNTYWGLGSEREDGLPPFEAGSWGLGLRRLLASYGMASDSSRMFGSLAVAEGPFAQEDYEAMASFGGFANALAQAKASFSRSADLQSWRRRLLRLAQKGLGVAEGDPSSQPIAQALHGLGTTDVRSEIPFEWVELHLKEQLQQKHRSPNPNSDAVFFSNMLSSRGLPFKVVCLLGLNGSASKSDAFPKKELLLPFDLMRQRPEPSDWSKREEDMHLFLEHIAACQEVLVLSYQGGNAKTQQTYLPSVVVQDLEEAVKGFYPPGEQGHIAAQMSHKHPTYGFDKVYFEAKKNPNKNKLVSYSQKDYKTARALMEVDDPKVVRRGGGEKKAPFNGVVDVGELVSFFKNPTRFFYKEQLGVRLCPTKQPEASTEPFDINPLLRHTLSEALTQHPELDSLEKAYNYFERRSEVPLGNIGKQSFSKTYERLQAHRQIVEQLKKNQAPQSTPIKLPLADLQVGGVVEAHNHRIVAATPSPFKGKHLWDPWLSLLMLASANAHADADAEAFLVAKEDVYHFTVEPETAPTILSDLLATYQQGFLECIPFFASASYTYVERAASSNPKEALEQAEATYESTDKTHDDWVRFAYRYQSPFDKELREEFTSWSTKILEPLVQKGRFKKLKKEELRTFTS